MMNLRKFTEPKHLDSASSPVHLPGADPVVRTDIPNRNLASTLEWKFAIEKLNAFNFFVTGVNFPGINLGAVYTPTPFSQMKSPGDGMNFEPLTVEFLVAEDLENILELQRWMRGLGPSKDHRENRALNEAWGDRETSDASLTLTTNAGTMERIRIHFHGLFPIAINGFDLRQVLEEIQTTASFEYTYYDIEHVPDGAYY